MAEQHKCCGTKYVGRWNPSARCKNNAKVERDGMHYCKVHDPVAKKEKYDAIVARIHSKLDADEKARAAAATKQQELERNAARYLFLRDAAFSTIAALFLLPLDEMDAAIDAKIAKGKP